MLHKNLLSSSRSGSTDVNRTSSAVRETNYSPALAALPDVAPRLRLVPPDGGNPSPYRCAAAFDLLGIAANKCSSFLAEAAVLVLVFALLDRFLLKGSLNPGWIAAAFLISIALLAGSILTDFSARRWLQ